MTTWPKPEEGDYIIKDFIFAEGKTLPELNIHYRTVGKLKKDQNAKAKNAVLVMHGTTGNGGNFFRYDFAGKLFNPGQLLSAEDYYLIFPDGIGHGQSTKPSDELRAKFPRYCYGDMVRAQYMLLREHLDVNHLRLVIGTSMGGMHTWVWGTKYSDFMDALMPLASLPSQIAGRNRMTRKMMIDSIRLDPEFKHGNYTTQPPGLKSALQTFVWMQSCPLKWQKDCPDRESADDFIDSLIEVGMHTQDANDLAYAFDASWDYDPRPGLKDVKVPLTAVNFADDQVNPPELRILETEIEKVEKGVAIVKPISDETVGHGTHTVADVWIHDLKELLERSQ